MSPGENQQNCIPFIKEISEAPIEEFQMENSTSRGTIDGPAVLETNDMSSFDDLIRERLRTSDQNQHQNNNPIVESLF
jgi:hypothetical protein